MHETMAAHVERGTVPGFVTLLHRHGEIHADAIGTKALGGSEPMRRDTIFRITSMTKPITAVAALILVEECALRLDEPIDRLLPELADRRVLRRIDGPLSDTDPAHRPITVRDLLCFTAGLGLQIPPAAEAPIQKAIEELGIVGFGPPNVASPHDPDEWLRRVATLPLMHQPGEGWMYNTGSYLLGVLVARAAGKPLEDFFRERIFAPLGMKDTSFSVPAGKLDRLATSYWPNASGALDVIDDAKSSQWSRPPAFPDGGAGLVSTADDYLAFAHMLLDKGRCGTERILSRRSIETMTIDHLTPAQKAAARFAPGYWDAHGWGFGVGIDTRRDEIWTTPGRYGWDGGYGTSWANDPSEGLIALLMTQSAIFPLGSPLHSDFWTSAYQAIDD
jgi:CubicO group peptidase (beta-lactamase class C family)